MKHKLILKNSILVLVLFGMFAMPFVASGFIEYDKPQSDVLGVQSEFKTVLIKNDDNNVNNNDSDVVVGDKPKVVDRIDVELTLAKGNSIQKFYDVLAGYNRPVGTEVVVVVPTEYEIQGFGVVKTDSTNEKVDLIVKVPSETSVEVLPVTLLIVE